jgi:hypothetical protein
MFKGNTFMDAIHPDEHTRFEGGYTIPLYTHQAKTLTDDEINKTYLEKYDGHMGFLSPDEVREFARAILRKAQEK